MASILVQPPFPASHVIPPNMIKTTRLVPTKHPRPRTTKFGEYPFGSMPIYITRVAEQSSSLVGDDTFTHVKTELYQALKGWFSCIPASYFLLLSNFTVFWGTWWWNLKSLLKWVTANSIQGINRGIFGVPSAKKSEIEDLVKMLESLNPTPDLSHNLEKVYPSEIFVSWPEFGSNDFP